MSECVPLHSLKPRQCGVVDHVEAQDDDIERLMAMGVCAGRTVELVQDGDPMIIKVYGTRVGISARLGSRIHVLHCEPGSCGLNLDLPNEDG